MRIEKKLKGKIKNMRVNIHTFFLERERKREGE